MTLMSPHSILSIFAFRTPKMESHTTSITYDTMTSSYFGFIEEMAKGQIEKALWEKLNLRLGSLCEHHALESILYF